MIINVKKLLRYLKYIALIVLGVSGLASFSSAYSYEQDFSIPDTFVKGNTAYTILRNFNISTTYQNTVLNHIFFSESNLSSNGRNRLHSFFAWYDKKPYLYADYIHDGHRDYVYQGFPTQFCLAPAGSGQSVCVPSGWNCPRNTNIDVFYNAGILTHGAYYGYGDMNSTYQVWTYCVSDDVNDYCFNISADSYNCGTSYLTGSLNVPGTSIEQLQSFDWSSSPFYGGNVPIQTGPGLDDYTYISVGTGDYVDYFENELGFNYNMCFVGTTDLSGLYEDRIPYYQGTGYSIFDVYNKLFNTSNMKISKVGTFLNTWLINYRTWFLGENRDINNNPLYNATYSLVNGFQLEYGSGLVNPFLGNKAVYYFIPSTLIDLNNSNVDGEQVAFYCYKKLVGEWNYNGGSNAGLNNNITDDHNKAYDNRTAVYKRNKNNSSVYFSGANIIESQSWDGTPLDYFEGEENLDFSSFFSNAFNKFRDNYGSLSVSDSIVGVLPNYIVLFLLAVILFKFLRK